MRGAKDTHTVPRISVCGGTTGGREEEEEDDDDERTERNGRTGEELGDKRERETEENEETCGGWRELLGRSRSGRRSRVSERGVKHGSRAPRTDVAAVRRSAK